MSFACFQKKKSIRQSYDINNYSAQTLLALIIHCVWDPSNKISPEMKTLYELNTYFYPINHVLKWYLTKPDLYLAPKCLGITVKVALHCSFVNK